MAHTHTCCQKQKLKRGLWSPDEDEKLLACIMQHGPGSWSSVPTLAGIQRCGKSCRLRWINYLRPDLKRGSFSALEEKRIVELHAKFGNKWSKIASHLPGRTDNEIKNLWNSNLKKSIEKKTVQSNMLTSNAANAHNAAALKRAAAVLQPYQATPTTSSCVPSRPIFPFLHVEYVDTKECKENVLLATQSVSVKPHLESKSNQALVNKDLIISGHALQETLLSPQPVNYDEPLIGDNIPRQEVDQFLVSLAQFPGLQSLEPVDQMVISADDHNTHINGWQPIMDVKASRDCQEVSFLQLQQASNLQAPCESTSLHGSAPYESTQLHTSRENLSLIDYGFSEVNSFGGNYHSYLVCSTAEYNNIYGGVYSLKHHQQHDLTAADLGIPCSTPQLGPMSHSPSTTCSHELGPMSKSPSTTCSDDDSSKSLCFSYYHDIELWLEEACTKATCNEFY